MCGQRHHLRAQLGVIWLLPYNPLWFSWHWSMPTWRHWLSKWWQNALWKLMSSEMQSTPYFPPLGEAHGSIECRDPNIDPLGAIWTPPSCILGCSEPSSQTGYRNILGEWQCADGYDGAGAGFETGGCGSGFGPTVLYLWETYTVYKLQ